MLLLDQSVAGASAWNGLLKVDWDAALARVASHNAGLRAAASRHWACHHLVGWSVSHLHKKDLELTGITNIIWATSYAFDR